MKFESMDDLIKYVNEKTEYQIEKKIDVERNAINRKQYIFSGEGRKDLKEKGFFDKRFIWGRIGMVYHGFNCEGCKLNKYHCKKCLAVRTIIKSL